MLESKSFDTPDEKRDFVAKGGVSLVSVGGTTLMRGTYEPGWRWSEHAKPVAKTDSCMVTHTGVILSGRLHVRMDDGSEAEVGPGDAFGISPGHDAWVVGDESCVLIDVTGGAGYLKPS